MALQLRSMGQLLFDPGTLGLSPFLGLDLFWACDRITTEVQQSLARVVDMVWCDYRLDGLLAVFSLIGLLVLYAGNIRWVMKSRRSDWSPPVVLVATVLVYLLLMSAGPEAASRFRVPLMPWIVLFGVAGWQGRTHITT